MAVTEPVELSWEGEEKEKRENGKVGGIVEKRGENREGVTPAALLLPPLLLTVTVGDGGEQAEAAIHRVPVPMGRAVAA